MTRKIRTLEIGCLCLFIHHTISGRLHYRLRNASGSHSNNTLDTKEHLLFQQ